MLTWLGRLLGLQPTTDAKPVAPAGRLSAAVERLDELEARLDWLYRDHVKLRGRVTGAEKLRAAAQSRQDAPGTTNGDEPDPDPSESGDTHHAVLRSRQLRRW